MVLHHPTNRGPTWSRPSFESSSIDWVFSKGTSDIMVAIVPFVDKEDFVDENTPPEDVDDVNRFISDHVFLVFTLKVHRSTLFTAVQRK